MINVTIDIPVTLETEDKIDASKLTVKDKENGIELSVSGIVEKVVISGESRIDNFIKMVANARNRYLSNGKVIVLSAHEYTLAIEKPLQYISQNQVEFGVDFVEIGELVEETKVWKTRNLLCEKMVVDSDFISRVLTMVSNVYSEYEDCVSDCVAYSSLIIANILERKGNSY